MRGKRPDPSRARRKTGNRAKPGDLAPTSRALRAVPPAPDESWPPTPPEDLPEGAKNLWTALLTDFPPGLLRGADLIGIRMIAILAHRAFNATAKVERYGELVEGRAGPIANPMARLERDSMSVFLRFAQEYAMTLIARGRHGLVLAQGATLAEQLADIIGTRDDDRPGDGG